MSHTVSRISYVADIAAWTGSGEEVLRVGTHSFSTLPHDTPANAIYRGLITDVGVIDRSIFQGNGLSGEPQVSQGYIELGNAGEIDNWINYGFDGRSFVVARMPVAGLFATRQRLFTGTLLGIDASNAWTSLRLIIRDRLRDLDSPLLTERYAGTTNGPGATIEGNTDLKDQIKPWVLGSVRNITPKPANPYDLIYQVSKDAVSSITVKVGGQTLTSAGDALSLQALQSMSIPNGQYATCVSCGVFRTANSAVAPITCDVVEGSTAASRTVAQLALKMLLEHGIIASDYDAASFTAADAFNSSVAGIYIEDDSTTLTMVSRMLDSAGFALIPDLDGVYYVAIMRDPSALAPVAELDLNDITTGSSLTLRSGVGTEGEGVPAYSIVLNYDRNYTQMDLSQLAGILTDAEKVPFMEETKKIKAQDLAVQTAHPLAPELTKDTFFAFTTDAQTEATRLLNLYKVRRDRLAVTLHDEDGDDIELGDCVRLTLDRFGYDAGKKFIVLGKRNEFRTRSIVLSLWG